MEDKYDVDELAAQTLREETYHTSNTRVARVEHIYNQGIDEVDGPFTTL